MLLDDPFEPMPIPEELPMPDPLLPLPVVRLPNMPPEEPPELPELLELPNWAQTAPGAARSPKDISHASRKLGGMVFSPLEDLATIIIYR